MRTRAILTATAAAAATLGSGLASAGTAAATTAPLTTRAPATAPKAVPTPGVLAVENALKVADNWCVAPDVLPTPSHVCDDRGTDGDGVHVLSNMCLVPLSLAGALGSGPPTAAPCPTAAGGPGFELLRNVSVAGVQTTF
ncbi:hypothetical protein KGQ20_32935 [Catenulispora sp. NF23]|uniref:Secreted protein n=1 Tax=Catenulispora pinistramenti TaxID=2705254 RepID=A0ABS5L5I8_9ACTN|nr:hypothetical protein [Catenulispora pinistramenti]MBS2537568.1 hypothetical protein [Catenulispora pinistramenti]MBS2553502.1 hypothetical protein [Catenulispora pinistramenti]